MIMILVICFSSLGFSYKPGEGNVTFHVGPFFYKTDFKSATTAANSPYLTGLGFIANGDINDRSSLEIAMFHLNKRFLRQDQDQFISESTQIIHITMGYKRFFTRYISSSLAFYSAYPLGHARILYSSFPKGSEIPTSARDLTEYGFDLSLQGEVWSGPQFDVVAEFRYSMSVTSRSNEDSDHYGTFIGLRYLLQEKTPEIIPSKKTIPRKP